MNTVKFNKQNVKMVAHRGVSGIERENTHASFIAAGNRSYWGIETDIHRTADGQFVVIHDESTLRVAGVNCNVEQTDMSVLQSIRLYERGVEEIRRDLCLPTLQDYVRICKRYEKECVLELKNPMGEENIGRIIEIIEGEEYLDHVVFISFSFDNLVYVRKYRPEQRVQFLFSEVTDEIFDRVVAHRFDVDVRYKRLTAENIRRFHDAGLQVNCWTVDDPENAEALVAMGVDYITTDILE
ncbi:MAG: hypothetical protein IJX62_03215 [Clostridia bacterium]|nr:hypothetical protein [Clostridia bacterium]